MSELNNTQLSGNSFDDTELTSDWSFIHAVSILLFAAFLVSSLCILHSAEHKLTQCSAEETLVKPSEEDS